MSRPQIIDDERLVATLAGVFREVGYEGASLAQLSGAAGLQKASLYHRFPGGKKAMADEVLARASDWMQAQVIGPLTGPGTPQARVAAVAARLDGFYEGGRRACLLNMLAAPRDGDGPFAPAIREALASLIAAFAAPARDAGHGDAEARAERAVAGMQGALVLSRGLGDPGPWARFLDGLAGELLE
jgi:TetR/AcrR family transcriptional regulator, lmrAB and yxaGH operons repressor